MRQFSQLMQIPNDGKLWNAWRKLGSFFINGAFLHPSRKKKQIDDRKTEYAESEKPVSCKQWRDKEKHDF